MPWLEIQRQNQQSHRIAVEAGAVLRVGRAADNDVPLVEEIVVSRHHAEIAYDGERCTVKNLSTTNGTWINERRITEPTIVDPGTWIHVGKTRMRLVVSGTAEQTAPQPIISPSQPMTGESVMLSVSEVMDSVQRDAVPDPQLRAFATLSKASGQLLAQRPLDEVLEMVVDLVFEIAAPDRGALMLLEGEPPALRLAASRGSVTDDGGLSISRTIADQVIEQQQSVMTTDAQMDGEFAEAVSIVVQNIRSAMCVPLWDNKRVIGLIYVDTQSGPKRFSKGDLEALTLVANVAAVKIDNVRLFQQEQRMKEIERELRAAARIQQRLLPAEPPQVPGYDLCGYNRPCFDVGGDYFDYLLRDPATLSIVVGDVSGKGMGAALLMASIQASLHAHASTSASVEELVSQLNRAVCRNSELEKFCTFFYGEVDVGSGTLRFCNAGHNPPLLVRAAGGAVEKLIGGGMVLGFEPDVSYVTLEVRLEPGDLLVAYSDGVTESMNLDEEEFGEERLIEIVRACSEEPVEQVRHRVDAAVAEFVGEASPFDDYTLVLLRRAP